jgi:transposase
MGNVLSEDKKHQVVALGRLGGSLRWIEEATEVRRETASAYLKAAGIPVRGRGGRPRVWPPKPATRAEVSTDSAPVPRPSRAPSASATEPYRELIADALRLGRNAMAIWQDLVEDHGFTARYASVRRFVLTLRGASSPEARVVITTAQARNAKSITATARWSVIRRPASTGARGSSSSRSVTRAKPFGSSCGSRARRWAELHERAFRRLGGTVRLIVLDNLKEGVLTPDIYDAALNPDVLAHYGVVALPCRVGDPDRKGKVEAGVGHAKKTPLRGLRFESLWPRLRRRLARVSSPARARPRCAGHLPRLRAGGCDQRSR